MSNKKKEDVSEEDIHSDLERDEQEEINDVLDEERIPDLED